jgi:hypothetical protein
MTDFDINVKEEDCENLRTELWSIRRLYRGYVFVNRALSSIQKGVQGSHAIVEVFNNALTVEEQATLNTWSLNDKTLVFLDGGFHGELEENYEIFKTFCFHFDLPCGCFYEDIETMNGMFTAFAGIIPHYIYDYDLDTYDREHRFLYSPDEIIEDPEDVRFCRFLRQFPLAR